MKHGVYGTHDDETRLYMEHMTMKHGVYGTHDDETRCIWNA